MSAEIEQLVQERFPGVELVSDVQGWAFVEQFERGVEAYARLLDPSPRRPLAWCLPLSTRP